MPGAAGVQTTERAPAERTAWAAPSGVEPPAARAFNETVIYGGRQPAQQFAQCVECRRVSGPYWMRWRACRSDVPDSGEEPQIALYCPGCAEREFGPPRRRPLVDRRREPRGSAEELA